MLTSRQTEIRLSALLMTNVKLALITIMRIRHLKFVYPFLCVGNPRPAENNSYSYTLENGKNITLTATFISSPGPVVRWLYRQSPYSEKRTIKLDDSHRGSLDVPFTFTYTIDSIGSNDFGQHFAVADNRNGIPRSTITFYLLQVQEGNIFL